MTTHKTRETIWREWRELVNMTAVEMEDWLSTDESRSVGARSAPEAESTGHRAGRRIVAIERTRKPDLDDDDWDEMATVVGYIRRHLAQGGPARDIATSRWRYSLINWGHDPMMHAGSRAAG